MTTELTTTDQDIYLERRALDRNPAAVYLASIGESPRRPMRGALDTIANWLAVGMDVFSSPWG